MNLWSHQVWALGTNQLLLDLASCGGAAGFAVRCSLPALSHGVCMNNKWARHLCCVSAVIALHLNIGAVWMVIYIQTEVPKTQKYLSQKMYEGLPSLLCSPLAR